MLIFFIECILNYDKMKSFLSKHQFFLQCRTIIDFNEVDIRIYLSEKVTFTKAARTGLISLLRVVNPLVSMTVLLYDFSSLNEKFLLACQPRVTVTSCFVYNVLGTWDR